MSGLTEHCGQSCSALHSKTRAESVDGLQAMMAVLVSQQSGVAVHAELPAVLTAKQ